MLALTAVFMNLAAIAAAYGTGAALPPEIWSVKVAFSQAACIILSVYISVAVNPGQDQGKPGVEKSK